MKANISFNMLKYVYRCKYDWVTFNMKKKSFKTEKEYDDYWINFDMLEDKYCSMSVLAEKCGLIEKDLDKPCRDYYDLLDILKG